MTCLLLAPQGEKPAMPSREPSRGAAQKAVEPDSNELESPAFVEWARDHGWRADEIVPDEIAVAFEPGARRAEREHAAARVGGRLGRDRTHRDGTSSSTILLPKRG